ncbi:MAG: hypothetical protein EFT35_02590 [Methanophagales archaeon ANME-1-THS]|nr:MAG: hypothetical protein EFT35_02590 [Methanophagales archaeon ANME-1-THS]
MKGIEIALLWDKELTYKRYLIDHGFTCEVVTPSIFAAPFFSIRLYRLIVVPAGFGNPLYSRILTELRATSVAISNFVRGGGTLLVSGAFSNRDAYNWLPITVSLVREERRVKLELVKEHEAASIVERRECFCDGYFEEVDAHCEVLLVAKRGADEKPLLVLSKYGAGRIIVTTIHEYPSELFIAYCVGT